MLSRNRSLKILKNSRGFLLTISISCTALPDQMESRSGEVLIIYSGNALGELKPCGCDKEEDQGGIERRMSYLKQMQEPNTLLVDLGDNFKESTRQGKLKAQTMMKALARMKYDAITLGDKDLLYGNKVPERPAKHPVGGRQPAIGRLHSACFPHQSTEQRP